MKRLNTASFCIKTLVVSLSVWIASCNIAKHLPVNERLYVGTDIRLKADSTVSKSEQAALKSGLKELARPRPNKMLLGYPYKVGLYYLFGKPKSNNGFSAWFRKKLGEPPVFASAKALSSNATIWSAYLENEGYFRSSVSGQLKEKGYKARGVYDVNVQPRYYVDSVTFLVDSTPVRKALFAISTRSLLKQNDPYRLDIIKTERERINQTLKNRGFFYFQPDFVGILADTARGNHRLRLYVAIKPDIPVAAAQPYYIRNLYVYPKYSLGDLSGVDTNRTRAYTAVGDTSLKRVFIVDSARVYKPALFNDILALKPGRRYSSRSHDLTLSRFINVGSFKFVRNRFAPTVQNDTAFLDVHYYLTPYPKRSVRFELDGVTRSNGLAGSQFTLSWTNRNFMGRSEILTINGTAGLDFQLGGGSGGTRNFRYGANATLTFPRLVSPIRFRYDQQQLLPKTTLSIGYERIVQGAASVQELADSLRKGRFYSLNSFNTSFGYSWRRNQRIEQSFFPFGINYVFLAPNDELILPLLVDPITRPRFQNLYFNSDQLILNSLYTVTVNSSPRTASPHTYRVQFTAEPAGNLASLLIRPDSMDVKRIFDNSFSQYIRTDIDVRYYYRPNLNLTWANRVFAGIGAPYGNSTIMPSIKQYFVGGSNSLRGFRARAIGPGIYARDTTGTIPLFFDGGGDVKLEINTELRPKFTKYIQGAVFIDAGNVWMFRDASFYGEGSQFGKNFLKQLAVSGGFGVRIDLSYFLIRVDLGTPLRKPYLTDGNYWVLDKINLRDRYWRRQNLILNIAIGYPF